MVVLSSAVKVKYLRGLNQPLVRGWRALELLEPHALDDGRLPQQRFCRLGFHDYLGLRKQDQIQQFLHLPRLIDPAQLHARCEAMATAQDSLKEGRRLNLYLQLVAD